MDTFNVVKQTKRTTCISPDAFVGERPLVVIFVCESVTALCSVWRGMNHATCLANHNAEATLELSYNHVCL